jgi:aminoglycoside 6'-N-acetyltransferase
MADAIETRDRLAHVIELRPMTADDLSMVARWLREPHVARWWLADTTADAELQTLRKRVSEDEDQETRMLTIIERDDESLSDAGRIGWCEWYPYDAYRQEAEALGARVGDCGIDYAIGDPAAIARGLGTQLIAALVSEVRRHHPGCGVIVDPDADNVASRRVLERNGFSLVAVRPVASELNDYPMAIYRLAGDNDQAA